MDKKKFTIQLSPSQEKILVKWEYEQDQKVCKLQGKSFPDYGPTGGGYSWIITQTSLGDVIHVRNNITNEITDLSEYGKW